MLQRSNPFELPTGWLARASGWPLIALLALYLIPGTLRSAPWKNEDAIYFGVVWRALESGDWLHFHLSTTLLPESPLYFWLSGVCGNLLQGWLPAPAAIRLSTTLFVAASFAALYLAARRLFDKPWAGMAPLTLAGCLGLLIASHDVQPMTAALAALSVLLYGMSLIRPTAHFAAAPLPLSIATVAVGFGGLLLASGFRLLPAAGLMFAAGFIHPQRKRYALVLVFGLGLGSAMLFAWLFALHDRSPALADAWIGHQLSVLDVNAHTPRLLWTHLTTLSWLAWPAWPLVAYTLWAHRQRLASPALLGPIVLLTGLLISLSLAGESRQAWLATMLPPFALLGVPALMAMRRGALSLLDWFGRAVFGLLLIVVALGWTALVFDWPTRWASKAAKLAPGFVPSIDPLAVAFSLLVIGAWVLTIVASRASPQKSLFAWTAGLIAFWATAVALWMPWVDYQRSYRQVATEIERTLGDNKGCLITTNLSEAQFAAIDYYLDQPMHRQRPAQDKCQAWLLTTSTGTKTPAETGWKRVWQGGRPGEYNERFHLYRRQ